MGAIVIHTIASVLQSGQIAELSSVYGRICMWSFSTFKDKRYWVLLILAIIILVLYAVFTPNYILEKPYIAPFTIIISGVLFWSTYHLWKYFGDKKKKDNTKDRHDF